MNLMDKPNQADYDFVEDYDNYEEKIDDELNRENAEKFKNELLFCVQELGSVKLYHDN